jgi:hypothetical protein
MNSSATGRFWICPVCARHVPGRVNNCQCGFDRSTVNVAMREAMPSRPATAVPVTDSPGRYSPFMWLAALALAVAAVAWLWKASQENDRANAELRERVAQKQAEREQKQADRERSPQQPQVIFVPQPQGPQPTPSPGTAHDPHAEVTPVRSDPAAAPMVVLQQPQPDMGDQLRSQQEMYWRERAMQLELRLAGAASAYITALCKEQLAGIPVAGSGTYNQYRNEYVQAIAEADSLGDLARRAGASAGWVRIRGDFPAPLPRDVLPSVASSNQLSAFNCASH